MPNSNVLYLAEYGLPLPRKLPGNIQLVTASTVEEAHNLSTQDGIDAFVLGMVTIKNGFTISEVDKLNARYRDILHKLISLRTAREEECECIHQDYLDRLDFQGGQKFFLQDLYPRGLIGQKPILWYTSQHGFNPLVQANKTKRIEVVEVPCRGKDIIDWFERNLQ